MRQFVYILLAIVVATSTNMHTVTADSNRSNPVSCNAVSSIGTMKSGEFACYGIIAKNNFFGTNTEMPCQTKSGRNTTGCVIEAPVCQSGQALAVTYYNVSDPALFTFNLYRNLNITENELKENVSSVWQYICTEKLKKQLKKVDILVSGVSKKTVAIPSSSKTLPFAIRSAASKCTITSTYGTKKFVHEDRYFYLSPVNQFGSLNSVSAVCAKEGSRTLRVKISDSSSANRDFSMYINSKLQTTIKNISRPDALRRCLNNEEVLQNSGSAGRDEYKCVWGEEIIRFLAPNDWKG